MTQPAITVGIPFLNAQPYLRSCIQSVLAQSFTDWEMLLVDDGSTDGSLPLARSVDDGRIRVLSDGRNLGLVPRLNQMVELARGRFFARMDADDMMHPERLARQWEVFQQRPAVRIVGTAAYVMDKDGEVYGVRMDHPASLESAGVRSGFIHPTVLARTAWLRRNPYDPAYPRAEDVELWRRVDPETPCARLLEPLLFYREPLEPQVSKYRASCRTLRKLCTSHRCSGQDDLRRVCGIAAISAKEALYLSCCALGLAPALIRRRNRPCTAREREEARRIQQQIALEPLSQPLRISAKEKSHA